MSRSWNLFSVGRRTDDEDQLTEMLVWLASAVPAVRGALVELGLQEDVDPTRIEATTQYSISGGRLDVLLEGEGCRLVVESKLGSRYSHDQIGKYLRWLAGRKSSATRSGLMTLTAAQTPWDQEDVDYARQEDLVASPRRWEDLHRLLQPLSEDEGHSLAARMVREFLEMLADEQLVPIPPLNHDELGTLWADSWKVVRRYRDFFRGCKDAIGDALCATAHPNAWSDRGDWFYQDYTLGDTTRVVVGVFYTDEREPHVAAPSRSPILWVGVDADYLEQWKAVAQELALNRPSGWREGNPWDGRPTIWRSLAETLGEGTFEEQRSRLAEAARDATLWLAAGVERVKSTGDPRLDSEAASTT